MMLLPAVIACTMLAACAGSQAEQKAIEDPRDDSDADAKLSDDEPRDEPKPRRKRPKPKYARAVVKPYKGVRFKSVTLDLSERDAEIRLTADVRGMKPGRYTLTIHERSRCGKTAKDAGAVWADLEPIKLVVDDDDETKLKPKRIASELEGDGGIAGRVVVLREDRKRGTVLGCGSIEMAEPDD